MDFHEPHDLLDYLHRGLITAHEWWMLRQLELFAFCWMAGGFENPIKPRLTKRISRCSLCGGWARVGIWKYEIRWDDMHGTFEGRFHPECFEKIKHHKVKQWTE